MDPQRCQVLGLLSQQRGGRYIFARNSHENQSAEFQQGKLNRERVSRERYLIRNEGVSAIKMQIIEVNLKGFNINGHHKWSLSPQSNQKAV